MNRPAFVLAAVLLAPVCVPLLVVLCMVLLAMLGVADWRAGATLALLAYVCAVAWGLWRDPPPPRCPVWPAEGEP